MMTAMFYLFNYVTILIPVILYIHTKTALSLSEQIDKMLDSKIITNATHNNRIILFVANWLF